jgi:hypothetical protein
MRRADSDFGSGKAKPDQSIKEIVPVIGARFDFTTLPDPAFVDRAIRLRRHEADLLSARQPDGMLLGQIPQRLAIGTWRQLVQPAPEWVVQE